MSIFKSENFLNWLLESRYWSYIFEQMEYFEIARTMSIHGGVGLVVQSHIVIKFIHCLLLLTFSFPVSTHSIKLIINLVSPNNNFISHAIGVSSLTFKVRQPRCWHAFKKWLSQVIDQESYLELRRHQGSFRHVFEHILELFVACVHTNMASY